MSFISLINAQNFPYEGFFSSSAPSYPTSPHPSLALPKFIPTVLSGLTLGLVYSAFSVLSWPFHRHFYLMGTNQPISNQNHNHACEAF